MISGRRVLALLTARGGSKGVPGKNLLQVGGRTLIGWAAAAAKESAYVDRIVISSDDDRLIAAGIIAGCDAPFVRDAALATDDATSIDVVLDALNHVPGYDIVVLLQPTSPLRTAADIDGALELLVETSAPTCVSVSTANDHPYWVFRRSASGLLSHFAVPPGGIPLRRQDLPPAWRLNGAVYAAQVSWIQSNRKLLCDESVGFVMPDARALDIDTLEDVEAFRAIVEPPLDGNCQGR